MEPVPQTCSEEICKQLADPAVESRTLASEADAEVGCVTWLERSSIKPCHTSI